MAKFVGTDVSVVLNSVDLSDRVEEIELSINGEVVDATTMGATFREKLGGLKDWSVSITFAQDFAANEVDATLFPIVGTSVPIVVKPTSAGVGATNPSFSGNVIVEQYNPLGPTVGELVTAPVTLQGNGVLTRATS